MLDPEVRYAVAQKELILAAYYEHPTWHRIARVLGIARETVASGLYKPDTCHLSPTRFSQPKPPTCWCSMKLDFSCSNKPIHVGVGRFCADGDVRSSPWCLDRSNET